MNINTIFYFVATKSEYETRWQNGDINDRTIVFVTDTGEIYKNGIRYGGLTRNEVINESTTIVNNNEYDDTEIRNSINRLLGLIDGLNNDLDNLISDKENDILSIINDVLSEYTWLRKNVNDMFHLQGWTDQLKAYLTQNGYIDSNGGTWTTLLQEVSAITGRVSSLQQTLNESIISEAQIKSWIDGSIAGIDLTTFALKTDLVDFLTLTDLNELLNVADFTTAFLSLRSDLDSAMATIGAWSHVNNGNDSILDLIAALQLQVDNLSNTVTTSLSSTVRQYLGDELDNGIASYLQQNQSGLILRADLDSAVAGLFSQTSKTATEQAVEGVANNIVNTAGFMTESDLDGAMATIFAQSDNGGAYDSTETYFWFSEGSLANVIHLYIDDISSFPVESEHTLTEMVGHVYSSNAQNAVALTAQEILDTITMISESTTPPTVGISYGDKQSQSNVIIGEITRLSKAEAALHKSKLYAAIQVGVKNDKSFIDMVAQTITLDASQVTISGSTLINYLTTNFLRVSDLEGNSNVTITADSISLSKTKTEWYQDGDVKSTTMLFALAINENDGFNMQTTESVTGGGTVSSEFSLNDGELHMYYDNKETTRLSSDGSGFLSKGNISWDKYGRIESIVVRDSDTPASYTSLSGKLGKVNGVYNSAALGIDKNRTIIEPGNVKIYAGGTRFTDNYVELTPSGLEVNGYELQMGEPARWSSISQHTIESGDCKFDSIVLETSYIPNLNGSAQITEYETYGELAETQYDLNGNIITSNGGNSSSQTPLYFRAYLDYMGLSFQYKEGTNGTWSNAANQLSYTREAIKRASHDILYVVDQQSVGESTVIFGGEYIYLTNDVKTQEPDGSYVYNLYVGDVHSSGTVTATTVTQTSDETLKNKVSDVNLTAEQIAAAPSMKFTFKDDTENKPHVGTTAQYWQNILPEVVGSINDNTLGLDYGVLATINGISLAKEIVTLKETIASLEARIQELETSK